MSPCRKPPWPSPPASSTSCSPAPSTWPRAFPSWALPATSAADSAFGISFDNWINEYRWTYGLSDTDIDNALNGVAKSLRRAAVKNPLGFYDVDFDQVAAAQGLPDADAFLTSMFNPKVTQYLRVTGFETKCDGAAAMVLMPTEMAVARGLDHKIIDILGTGSAAYEGATLANEKTGTIRGTKQCYELTGVSPDEIDLLFINDFFMAGDIVVPEEVGYVPRGEAWQSPSTAASRLTATSPSTPTVAAATLVTRTAPPASPTSLRPSSRCVARLVLAR